MNLINLISKTQSERLEKLITDKEIIINTNYPTCHLTDVQFNITQKRGTEKEFSGELCGETRDGYYHCVVCNSSLFSSKNKYQSRCGWPSFFNCIENGRLKYSKDSSFGMIRVEVSCRKCGSHLGHVFDDGPKPTGLRYCINSNSLLFQPNK